MKTREVVQTNDKGGSECVGKTRVTETCGLPPCPSKCKLKFLTTIIEGREYLQLCIEDFR